MIEPGRLEIIEVAGHRLRQNDRAMTIVTDWLKEHCYNKSNLATKVISHYFQD